MSYKIAILGTQDAVSGFAAVGAEAIVVSDTAQAETKIKEIYESDKYAVLFITEDWAAKLEQFLAKLPDRALPAVVTVPGHQGPTGAGLNNLRRIVERAVGSDILFNK